MLQLGFSLISPILLCLLFCSWLSDQFGLGSWIYLIGIAFGMISSGMTAWKFYRNAVRKANNGKTRQEKKKKNSEHQTAFNSHL